MGYAYYVLPDGREAGYGVEDVCNRIDCEAKINRGYGYLCGEEPDGHRDPDEPGCGRYYCDPHLVDHGCTNPQCEAWDPEETEQCVSARGHDGEHGDTEGGTWPQATA